jgi:hypothetical protein
VGVREREREWWRFYSCGAACGSFLVSRGPWTLVGGAVLCSKKRKGYAEEEEEKAGGRHGTIPRRGCGGDGGE